MKTLANCKPSEFLRQTGRIKKAVERWLTATDILNIRQRMPKDMPPPLPKGATKDEIEENKRKQDKALEVQMRKNMSAILDAVLDEHPDETLEVIALCCFIEPEDVDEYSTSFYLEAVSEIMNDKAVLGFFTSLARLGLTDISA